MPIASAAFLFLAGTASGFSPSALWSAWPQRRFVATAAPCLRHAELVERLLALEARYPGRLTLEEVGRSVQGRKIHLVTLGSGPRRILLWSQMHGDEPSATPALLDLADTLLASDEPEHRAILEGLTLLMVPMLNPDGAERYARRNAQAIDINRDALHLATPEGRLLKAVRDRLQPELGFNLHDQNRRTTVGDTGVLSTISLLAVSGDREGTLTPGRARAKRVCSAIARTLEPFVPGGIGALRRGLEPARLRRQRHRVGHAGGADRERGDPARPPAHRPDAAQLRGAAHACSTASCGTTWRAESPDLYEGLKRNDDGNWTDVLLAGGRVWQPWAGEPYRADVAFDVLDDDPLAAACAEPGWPGASRIREVGDGRLLGSARRLDARGPPGGARLRRVRARARTRAPGSTAETLAADGAAGSGPRPLARRARRSARGPGARGRGSRPPGGRRSRSWTRTPRRASSRSPLRRGRPSSPAVESALDALTRGAWRTRAAGRTLGELLGDLAGAGPDASSPVVAPDARASLVVLRPRADGRGSTPSSVDLEAVFIDGREPGGAR